MTRMPYDQAAKRLLSGALAAAGEVVIQREVRGEPQWVDVVFEPRTGAPLLPGLLGRIVQCACLLELFHDPPGLEPIRDCLAKQLLLHRERRSGRAADPILPLWIVSAGRPDGALRGFGVRRRPGWPRGVYAAAEAFGCNIVVVSELPVGIETLPIRLMGAGRTLRRAVADLRALAPDSWEAHIGHAALRVLAFSGVVPTDPSEEAIIMEIEETHAEWLRRVRDEARVEFRAEGALSLLLRLFERKLARQLATDERTQLTDRLARLGADRLGDVLLELDPDRLTAWLADPAAR
jgi:hypothetical protein